MAAHSSILAWRIPRIEKPGRLYSPEGGTESDTSEVTWHTHIPIYTLLNFCLISPFKKKKTAKKN